MKKEEISIDAAVELSQHIQNKCQVQKALSIAIGAIHSAFEDRNIKEPLGTDADINYVPILINLSAGIIDEIDSMAERLTDMIFNLKPENHN